MNRALNQTDKELIQLKLVYEKLSEKLPFVALVTSSFPQDKVREKSKKGHTNKKRDTNYD
jgi:hypothetical protein